MSTFLKSLIIVVFLTIFGCSNSTNGSVGEITEAETVNYYFTGTIKEINGSRAVVYAKLGGGEGNVFVDLSVNSNEVFRVGDKVKVGYDGTIKESNPVKINTLSVELIKE